MPPRDTYSRSVSLRFSPYLQEYLKERFSYRRLEIDSGLVNTLCIRTVKLDIYLRFAFEEEQSWPKNTVVIARIGFKKTRLGHGDHFIRFIESLASEFEISHIAIESCNAKSYAFSRKYGFVDCDIEGSVIVEIEKLRKTLKQRDSQLI